MTNRLSFWVVASVALVGACAIFLSGFRLASLLLLMHVPAVCAVVLLTRALVLAVRGQPWGLEFRGRTVLDGMLGIAAPMVFLLLWTVARESGVVSAQLSVKNTQFRSSSHWTGWQDRVPERPITNPGVAVTAPMGVLGDSFRTELRHQWSAGDGSQLHADLRLVCEPPFAGWPLYKSVNVQCRIEADVQMRRPSEDVARCATLTMTIEGTWTAIGIVSRRDFHEWLGRDLGDKARDAIGDKFRKLHEKK